MNVRLSKGPADTKWRVQGGREIVRRALLRMGMRGNAPVIHVGQSLKSAVDGGLLRK